MAIVGEFAPFVQFCFIACYVAFLLAKPRRWELILVTLAGAALGFVFVRQHLGPWISGLGLAAAVWAVLAPLFRQKALHPAIALLAKAREELAAQSGGAAAATR